jgi:hypothetical protein
MRLNRGTLIILAVSLIVIVGAFLLTSNQASQTADATPTPAGGGPLFPDLAVDSVISLGVTDNATGAFTRLEKVDGEWTISGPEDAATRVLDPEAITIALNTAVALAAESQFEVEDLAEFGLDNPAFTIEIDDGTTLNVVLVGNANPGETRFYVQRREIAVNEAGTPETAANNSVYLVMNTAINSLTDLIANPPFEALPTATVTPTATLNPMSEVEQATATAEAQLTVTSVFATVQAEAEATSEATAEATPEVTEEAGE